MCACVGGSVGDVVTGARVGPTSVVSSEQQKPLFARASACSLVGGSWLYRVWGFVAFGHFRAAAKSELRVVQHSTMGHYHVEGSSFAARA